jgi:hypothetical protein
VASGRSLHAECCLLVYQRIRIVDPHTKGVFTRMRIKPLTVAVLAAASLLVSMASSASAATPDPASTPPSAPTLGTPRTDEAKPYVVPQNTSGPVVLGTKALSTEECDAIKKDLAQRQVAEATLDACTMSLIYEESVTSTLDGANGTLAAKTKNVRATWCLGDGKPKSGGSHGASCSLVMSWVTGQFGYDLNSTWINSNNCDYQQVGPYHVNITWCGRVHVGGAVDVEQVGSNFHVSTPVSDGAHWIRVDCDLTGRSFVTGG